MDNAVKRLNLKAPLLTDNEIAKIVNLSLNVLSNQLNNQYGYSPLPTSGQVFKPVNPLMAYTSNFNKSTRHWFSNTNMRQVLDALVGKTITLDYISPMETLKDSKVVKVISAIDRNHIELVW